MQSHDKDNEHDATEISTGEVADVILLVVLQESLCAHNKAKAKDTTNESTHRTRYFGLIIRLLKGAALRHQRVTGGNHHTSSDRIGNSYPVFIKIGSKDQRNNAKAGAEGGNPAIVPNMLNSWPTDGLQRIGQGEVADESDNDGTNNGGLGSRWWLPRLFRHFIGLLAGHFVGAICRGLLRGAPRLRNRSRLSLRRITRSLSSRLNHLLQSLFVDLSDK
mmetsp:Transcript_2697/g.7926  ORF Transcript_2697/g.7926 Transcript_2697/m.7926 type:complete len:219 (-) Transcript_2697:188-844(-)